MIKYIFKSTSGSFFRTIGRILAYVLIGIIVLIFSNYINILNVSANTGSGWGIDMRFDGTLQFHDSNKAIRNLVGQQVPYTIGNTTHVATYQTVQTGTASKFNIALLSQFLANNVYYINYYVCTENGHYSNVSSSYGGFNDIRNFSNQNLVYSKIQDAPVSNMPITNSNVTFGDCSIYTQVIVPKFNNEWVSLNFENTLSSQKLSVFGVEITTGGMYSSTTNEDIKNQVQDMQTSINNNIDDMKQKQDETNSYLKDETPPDADISTLGTVQGLLPPGPVDSLLNIPFKFLSVLTSSMGGVCTPITGNFVFDSTLTLPCFSELIWDNNSVPSELLNWLSLIPSAFILIKYFKHLYKKVDRAVSMETSSDDEWGVI